MKKIRIPKFRLFGQQTQQLLLALLLATICYLLFKQFFIYPTFLFFNVLLSLQNTRRATFNVAFQRVIGSIIGSILGLLAVYFIPTEYMIFLLPVGLFFAAYLSYLVMNAFIPITLIILLMIMTDNYDNNAIYYAYQRIIMACIGVTISLATTYIYRAKTRTYKERFVRISNSLLEQFDSKFISFLTQRDNATKKDDDLINGIQKLRVVRERINHESVIGMKDESFYLEVIQLFADYYMNLQLLFDLGGTIDGDTRQQLQKYFTENIGDSFSCKENNDLLFNYHLQETLHCSEQLLQKVNK